MVLWRFKSCPRCGGDTFIDRELNRWYEHCLQCGYMCDLENIIKVKQQQTLCKREGEKGHDAK